MKELYAYGVSNIFASFFSCYPSAGSVRTFLLKISLITFLNYLF